MAREMKHSGIKWIGDIPQGWKLSRFKYCFRTGTGLNITKADLVDEGIPVVSYGQIHAKYNSKTHLSDNLLRYIPVALTSGRGRSKLQKNDFVFADTSEDLEGCGNAVFVDTDKVVYAGYHTVIARPTTNGDFRYLAYLFTTQQWRTQIQEKVSGVKVNSITRALLNDCLLIVPPISEQQAIANFLDAKCAEIDGLLEDIDKEVKILAEYKKSIISETVTRGLNHSVSMKQSGIPWVQEIPEHWKVMANKYLMYKVKEIVPIYGGQDIISLSMNGVIVRDLDAGGKMPTSFNGYQQITVGNLLMCLFDIDVTPRCIGLIKNDGLTSPAYSQFAMREEAYAPYYYYFYLKMDNTKELVHLSKNMRHSLNEEQFGMIPTIVPPMDEQIAISKYLDEKIANIDKTISDKLIQIDKLKEYKASLIYEYVTGKNQVI